MQEMNITISSKIRNVQKVIIYLCVYLYVTIKYVLIEKLGFLIIDLWIQRIIFYCFKNGFKHLYGTSLHYYVNKRLNVRG